MLATGRLTLAIQPPKQVAAEICKMRSDQSSSHPDWMGQQANQNQLGAANQPDDCGQLRAAGLAH